MKILLPVFVLLIVFDTSAQIKFPDLSYRGSIHQQVGLTNFRVDYERPMQRGRLIFGGLVPWGKPWRTGAGFHNTISFDKEVSMGGKKISAGTYHLVTIPDPKLWNVILTNDSNAFSQNKPYDQSMEAVRIEVKPEVSKKHYEASTIEIDIVNNDAVFTVSWDYTSVRFTISTGTTAQIMSQIRNMMKEDRVNPDEYGDAATFIAYNLPYLPPTAKDTAVLIIDKAIATEPKSWMYHTKRNIFWFSKDYKGYEKSSREWIDFVKKDTGNDHTNEIRRIEADLALYKGKW